MLGIAAAVLLRHNTASAAAAAAAAAAGGEGGKGETVFLAGVTYFVSLSHLLRSTTHL